MSNENFNEILTNFLIRFKKRPYHLAKFLIDNSAFNKTFINKLIKSEKLKSETENEIYISDINQLED